MTRQTVTLYNAQTGHAEISKLWTWCKAMLIAGHRLTVEAKQERRSDAQSRMMWSCLTDLSRQVDWYGQNLSPEDWKHMLTASLQKQRSVPGIDGGFVVLGTHTSKMTKGEMNEMITACHAFGAQHDVRWSPASVAMDTEDV